MAITSWFGTICDGDAQEGLDDGIISNLLMYLNSDMVVKGPSDKCPLGRAVTGNL